MDLFDIDQLRKSFAKVREDELQPFEMAIARLARDLGGLSHLDEKSIIGIHKVCNECDKLLKNQFKG
jgi:hypothetical protein